VHGKNTWVRDYIADKFKVFFITSRKMTKDQMNTNENFSDNYDDCIKNKKSFVISHHSLEGFFKNISGIKKLENLNFKYLVIDEIHSIITDSTYTKSAFYLLQLIDYFLKNKPNIKIIGMSATNESLKNYFENILNFKHYDFSNKCINIKPKCIKIINKNDALEILSSANYNNKMIYMSNSASYIYIYNTMSVQLLKNYPVLENSIGILGNDTTISDLNKNSTDAKINAIIEKMSKINEYLTEKEILPSDINILLTTSKIKEGVNINDENVKAIFCESHDMIDIIQFSGRCRKGVDTLYIIHNTRCPYDKKVLKEYDFEVKYLSDFEADKINLFYNILKYKTNNDKKVECGEVPLKYIITPSIIKDYKNISGIFSKYTSINYFKEYIENKYSLIRYNMIMDCFDVYFLKYNYISEHIHRREIINYG
jgi:hypothetical protein